MAMKARMSIKAKSAPKAAAMDTVCNIIAESLRLNHGPGVGRRYISRLGEERTNLVEALKKRWSSDAGILGIGTTKP